MVSCVRLLADCSPVAAATVFTTATVVVSAIMRSCASGLVSAEARCSDDPELFVIVQDVFFFSSKTFLFGFYEQKV